MMRPYYQDSAVTIYHGDCREIVPPMPQVDMILTDPPYNEVNDRPNFGGWSIRSVNKGGADSAKIDVARIADLLVDATFGSIYAWCGFEQFSAWVINFRRRELLCRALRWEKTNHSPLNGQHAWLSDVELGVFAHRKNAVFNGFCSRCRWLLPSKKTTDHPTEKPYDLFSAIISASSRIDNVILDPFMGSGTTLRAAKDLGRRAIGIEIEEKYCEIAAKRMAQEVLPL